MSGGSMAVLKRVKNFLAPLPVVLVTTRLKQKSGVSDNIIPISWTGIVESAPHMVNINISRGKYSGKVIRKTREFAIAIPGAKNLKEVDICGTVHGDKTDKFELTGLEKFEAAEIDVPLIKQCPINMECRLENIVSFKSHDMYIGRIVSTHIDDDYIDKDGEPDFKKIDILCYVNGDYWTMGKRVVKLFFTRTGK
ncbi:MAG TPA: hypothetical protein DCP02_07005 [Actinobacteria bacterium]|nr:hypothetical protein [Actinomycetota bacterium]